MTSIFLSHEEAQTLETARKERRSGLAQLRRESKERYGAMSFEALVTEHRQRLATLAGLKKDPELARIKARASEVRGSLSDDGTLDNLTLEQASIGGDVDRLRQLYAARADAIARLIEEEELRLTELKQALHRAGQGSYNRRTAKDREKVTKLLGDALELLEGMDESRREVAAEAGVRIDAPADRLAWRDVASALRALGIAARIREEPHPLNVKREKVPPVGIEPDRRPERQKQADRERAEQERRDATTYVQTADGGLEVVTPKS